MANVTVTAGSGGGSNLFNNFLISLPDAPGGADTATVCDYVFLEGPSVTDFTAQLRGSGFTYLAGHYAPVTGVINEIRFSDYVGGAAAYSLIVGGLSLSPATFEGLIAMAFTDGPAAADDALNALLYGGDDTFVGSAKSDTIYGLGGADVITGGARGDHIDGGDGADAASYSTSAVAVRINLQNGVASGGDASGDVLVNIENVIGSSGDDALYGDTHANALSGGNGNDLLSGGGGGDLYDGGKGIDTLSYAGSTSAVNIDLRTGVASGDAAGDTFVNIENLIGGKGDDVLTGAFNINVLTGGAGNDTLAGGGGGDVMIGGKGNDTYYQLDTDVSFDIIIEDQNSGLDTVIGSGSGWLVAAPNIENLILSGVDAYKASGNELNNVITGTNRNDELRGEGGNDTLYGGAGDQPDNLYGGDGDDYLDGQKGGDTMFGGAGNDTFIVYTFLDHIWEDAGGGIDTIYASVADYCPSNVENLVLTGAGAISANGNELGNVLTGNSANNQLVGGAGGDTLLGGKGNDTLAGQSGRDTLTGGGGNDKFVFDVAAIAGNSDTITDFVHGHDKMLLDADVFTALGPAGSLDAKFFVGTSAHDADDRVIYDSTAGKLYYDNDGTGAHGQFLIATLTGHPTLSVADIQVV